MNEDDFTKYLNDRYQGQIQWYDRKAEINQSLYQRLQWTLIILSTATPVLIELNIDVLPGSNFAYVAMLTSLGVAVLTAASKTFKYQENWIEYRSTCEALRKEIYRYKAGLSDYQNAEDREALFVECVENLISRENTKWLYTHRTDKTQTNSPSPDPPP